MNNKQIKLIKETLEELDWDSDKLSEIMPDFFNSPMDAIESSGGEISEAHYNTLWEALELDLEYDEDGEEINDI